MASKTKKVTLPKATTTAGSVKPIPRWKLISYYVLVGLIGLGVVLFLQNKASKEAQFEKDKVRYAQVEKDMQQAYEAMVIGVGSPQKKIFAKSCSRSHLKFSRGTLQCQVSHVFSYQTQGSIQAIARTKQIEAILANDSKFSALDDRRENSLNKENFIEFIDLKYEGTLSCTLNNELKKRVPSPSTQEYTFACTGNVAKSVYSYYD